MRRSLSPLRVTLLVAGAFASPSGAATTPAGIEPALAQRLERAGPADVVPVLVRYEPRGAAPAVPSAGTRAARRAAFVEARRARAATAEAPLRALLRARIGADPVSLWLVGAASARIPAALVRDVAALPGVVSIGLDADVPAPAAGSGKQDPLEAGGQPPSSGDPAEWNLVRVRAPELWDLGLTGTGVVIASLDTGVDAAHQDLEASWRGGSNSWFDPYGQHAAPFDASGHGTQAMGLLVGADLGGTYLGVAPQARWIAAKAFDDAGNGTFGAIHQAFQWALDPDGTASTDDAPHAVNASWSLPPEAGACNEEFAADIAALKDAGIAVVFAAGDGGPGGGTSLSPANNSAGYAVGATNGFDLAWSGSSRGPSACDGTVFPTVSAPGANLLTSDLTWGGAFPDAYAYVDGTSFAAPHVTAGAALLLAAFPGATVAHVEWALRTTAVDRGLPGADDVYGAGVVDLVAAYDALAAGRLCTDADGDGVAVEGGACGAVDCNDDRARAWTRVEEVADVRLGALGGITWTAVPTGGAVAGNTVYDTLRADGADGFGAGTCVESNDGKDTTASDASNPFPGSTFFYLVRAQNDCGEGTLGRASSGVERSGASCP